MILNGYIKLTATYQCKWCERFETLTFEHGVWVGDLDNWREYDPSVRPGANLCSSDCQKELDAARNQAIANCEPAPPFHIPVGFEKELEKLRQAKMLERKRKYEG